VPWAPSDHVLKVTNKKVVNIFFRKKGTLAASVAPNVKSWLSAWLNGMASVVNIKC